MKRYKGGSFVLENDATMKIFTPEQFTDEHLMMAHMTEKFMIQEVLPVLDKIEDKQFEQTVRLLEKAGELGLLGIDVPENYGGLALDKMSSTLITEKVSLGRSFAVTYGGQVGIGSLPLVYFGNEEQKKRYLGDIISGKKIGAYALTEPTSGTDALGARTTAHLSDCRQFYILNGEKQWITNSAFANVFIVYAKVNGEKFTAFIVEKDDEGVSTGPEEKKMGLHGSSTRSLILDEVKVPLNNVLGEIGRGHVIAFNILNIGRHKISATCLGTSKRAIELTVQYAKERKQFGQSLTDFHLIKSKIAEMAIKTYVNESMIYRTAGALEDALVQNNGKEHIAKVIAEFAVECSINKVYSSEALDEIIDEAVQIHGGYGYMAEYEVETLYRDSRVNRIFEGTNEINRILITSTLLRNHTSKLAEAKSSEYELTSSVFKSEVEKLQFMKLLYQKVATSFQEAFDNVTVEQEILAFLADVAIEIYAVESALLRTLQAVDKNGLETEKLKHYYLSAYTDQTAKKIALASLNIVPHFANPELESVVENIISQVLKSERVDHISINRIIANEIIESGKFIS